MSVAVKDLAASSRAAHASGGSTWPEVAGLMYHEVTDEPRDSGFQRPSAYAYTLGRRAFADHLDEIATTPQRPARVMDIDLASPGRHLLLTFDDGGRSAADAGDELCRHGWRGHFFIVSSLIGARGFLDRAAIRHIHACGHVVGSHSHTHPAIFRQLPFARMLDEWRQSGDQLSQLLGDACSTASVPGGDDSRLVHEAASIAGIRYLFTSEPTLRPRRVAGCWVLGRAAVKASTSRSELRRLVLFHGWRRARLARRMKVLASTLLPLPYRWYVGRRGTTRLVGG